VVETGLVVMVTVLVGLVLVDVEIEDIDEVLGNKDVKMEAVDIDDVFDTR